MNRRASGFTLLPVVLAMSLTASIAYLLNRDNGINANLIGVQSDREHARYAAEAGLQAANQAIQANACAGGYPVSGSPVTDANFGGAAYSAYANNSSGWPLTLTSTGTYNGASVTLTRANVYVYQSAMQTWVVQPGPATGKDATAQSTNPTRNYGGDIALEIDRNEKQVLIAFDLTPLPAGSRIVRWFDGLVLRPGAAISLNQYSAIARQDFSVKLVTHDWVAGSGTGTVPAAGTPGVTWDRWDGLSPNTWPQGPGNGYDPRTLIVVNEPAILVGWLDIDVTTAALGWTSGVYPNYGVWLVGTNPTRDYLFRSSDYTGVNLRPKFTASYLLPCGAAAPP